MIRATSSTCSGRSLLSSAMTSSTDAILPHATECRKSTLWQPPGFTLVPGTFSASRPSETGPNRRSGKPGRSPLRSGIVKEHKGTSDPPWVRFYRLGAKGRPVKSVPQSHPERT
jgi:hypothetical protein